MGARHADRLWILGGVVVLALLVLAGYLLLIKPKYDEAETVRGQTETSEIQLITLRRRIGELKVQKAQMDKYKADRAAKQAAMPATSGLPDLLRQLQSSSDQVGVSVSGISVSAPEVATEAGSPAVYSVPITVGVDGTAADLGRFLTDLQSTQARAILIDTANLSPKSGTDDAAGTEVDADSTLSLSLSLHAFVAPPAGAGTPSITTTN